MIILNSGGGLGNQLFIYSYARAISEEFNDETIYFSYSYNSFLSSLICRRFVSFSNCLTHFTLNPKVKHLNVILDLINGLLTLFFRLYQYFFKKHKISDENRFFKLSNKGIYLSPEPYIYFSHSSTSARNKFIITCSQSEKYFSHIKSMLVEELKLKTPPSIENLKMINELSECNSVCVHIRRGDYLDKRFSALNVCNEDYYKRSMNYITDKIEKPIFYIFSNNNDEINWIKQYYNFNYNVKYIELNNPDYEELRLMYSCKHFIIANSTLSWWGSYLSSNPDKIVCAPSKWIMKSLDAPICVYRNDMVLIDV